MYQSFIYFLKKLSYLRFCPWCFARDSNVYIKTTMHWFQFPQILRLMSLTVTSFLYQCYSFNVDSVLFIILKIVLFACLNKELSLCWIFSHLASQTGGLENEPSLTIFYLWQIIIYIETYLKRVKDLVLLSK